MRAKPAILVFDVNETLLDITVLEPLFARLFGEARAMREWFAQMVLYSQAVTLAGIYAPFGALGAGALKMLAAIHGVAIAEADLEELRQRMGTMPAHSENAAALARLRDAGFRLATLSNSPPATGTSPLEHAGLAGFFERSFSVDAVRRFKPAPETYRRVEQTLGAEPATLCLVAAHAWDTLGAQAAGWAGALVTRPGNAAMPVDGVPQPDVTGADLAAVADAIVSWDRPAR